MLPRRLADVLTFIRIVLSVPLALSIYLNLYSLAFIIAVVGALTDFWDGFFARKNSSDTNVGKVLDPLADKIFILSGLVALVGVDRVSSLPVIFILIREFSVSFLRSLMMLNRYSMPSSTMSKIKTFLEFLSLILLIEDVFLGVYLIWISVAVAYVSAFEYFRLYLRYISSLNYH